jgi:hypothetical protein
VAEAEAGRCGLLPFVAVISKKAKPMELDCYILLPIYSISLNFTYIQIFKYLGRYIVYKKEQLLDPRNIALCRCMVKNNQ